MLYCCGSKDEGEQEHRGADAALMRVGDEAHIDAGKNRELAPLAGIYETSDMPELLPPSVPPSEFLQRRTGQRAPKLGQIGRSKRVVIEDEDLDDVLNNNGELLVQLSNAPA